MAQRQRVGFQTRRLGVQIPLGSYLFSIFARNQGPNKGLMLMRRHLHCLQSSVGRAVGC